MRNLAHSGVRAKQKIGANPQSALARKQNPDFMRNADSAKKGRSGLATSWGAELGWGLDGS